MAGDISCLEQSKVITKESFDDILNRIKHNTDLKYKISAPGKLILFGEHSVVYGKSALAASINKRTYLCVTRNKINKAFAVAMRPLNFYYAFNYNNLLKFVNEDVPGIDEPILKSPIEDPNEIDHDKFFENLVTNYEQHLKSSPALEDKEIVNSLNVFLYLLHGIFYKVDEEFLPPLFFDILSELTLGAGTGSSASFCVSIAATLLYYRNAKLFGVADAEGITFSEVGLKQISKWAFNGEKIMHGKPSGIDNTVATFGSFIEIKQEMDLFTKEMIKRFLNLKDPPKIQVILIDTGVLRNTANLVKKVSKLKNRNPQVVTNILNAMHEVCENASIIIKNMGQAQVNNTVPPEFELLEELVDVNQGLLYSLGASHRSLDEISLICSAYGLHAKLTGAGGGGYAFTLVPPGFDKQKLTKCIDELTDKKFIVCDIELGTEGVKMENN